MMDARRKKEMNDRPVQDGPVVYWMQREQRANDNWPLLYAHAHATERQVPLYVVFSLSPTFGGHAEMRHHDFLLAGLREVQQTLAAKYIPFFLLRGEPAEEVVRFARAHGAGQVITDFNPLRFVQAEKKRVAADLSVRLTMVDGHNIIPCWVASDKEEFAAHTFRSKVHRQLADWLVDYPALPQHRFADAVTGDQIDRSAILKTMALDTTVPPVSWCSAGEQAALDTLETFMSERLSHYADDRNDPNRDALSNLSPYLHYGHISAQRIALEIKGKRGITSEHKNAFLEELIVRRELTDNYCYYNPHYDKVEGAHEWAQTTIATHAEDEREYVYERQALEQAKTHDEFWNAMQRQMVTEGKMHGWCRMYWAKKILEWSPSHQVAIDRALYLNDKYELDGRDPNGVVGVMWSICGVHDRAWTERPIFGKIRYMNYRGAKRKFDTAAYIARYSGQRSLDL